MCLEIVLKTSSIRMMILFNTHSEKSGAKKVPQRSWLFFAKRSHFSLEKVTNGASKAPKWCLFAKVGNGASKALK